MGKLRESELTPLVAEEDIEVFVCLKDINDTWYETFEGIYLLKAIKKPVEFFVKLGKPEQVKIAEDHYAINENNSVDGFESFPSEEIAKVNADICNDCFNLDFKVIIAKATIPKGSLYYKANDWLDILPKRQTYISDHIIYL